MRHRFKRHPIGWFHIDIAELSTKVGKLYLLAAIDQTTTFALMQLIEKAEP